MVALQPQPLQMPPPPFDKDVLQSVFAEVIQSYPYQGLAFTPDGRGAVFNNGPEDTVELRLMMFRIEAKMDGPDVLTAEMAESKVIRILSAAAEKLNVGAGQASAEGTREATEVVLFHLGHCHGRRAYDAITWYFPQHGEHFNPRSYINACNGSYHE
jgi:hypothetical protein